MWRAFLLGCFLPLSWGQSWPMITVSKNGTMIMNSPSVTARMDQMVVGLEASPLQGTAADRKTVAIIPADRNVVGVSHSTSLAANGGVMLPAADRIGRRVVLLNPSGASFSVWTPIETETFAGTSLSVWPVAKGTTAISFTAMGIGSWAATRNGGAPTAASAKDFSSIRTLLTATQTLAAADVMHGLIETTPTAAITLTLPTGSQLTAADPFSSNGDTYTMQIKNTGTATVTLVSPGSDITVTRGTIAAGALRNYMVRRVAETLWTVALESEVAVTAATSTSTAATAAATKTFSSLGSSAAAATMTTAEMMGGVYTITASAALALTTATAADLTLADATSADGDTYEFHVHNDGTATVTLTAGAGVTVSSGTTIGAGRRHTYYLRRTGAAAWTVLQRSDVSPTTSKTFTTVGAVAATATMTAVQMMGGAYTVTPTVVATVTTATASDITAADAYSANGDTYEFSITNAGTAVLNTDLSVTLAAGTGVTIPTDKTITIVPGQTRFYRMYRTGAAAWTVIHMSSYVSSHAVLAGAGTPTVTATVGTRHALIWSETSFTAATNTLSQYTFTNNYAKLGDSCTVSSSSATAFATATTAIMCGIHADDTVIVNIISSGAGVINTPEIRILKA
jgi:hypothetical protein